MTVVLEVGARFSGHASCSTLTSRMQCACCASEEPGLPVMAMIRTPSRTSAGQDRQQLIGLAAGAERERHVAFRHHAEIAVERVERVQHHRRAAGAGERGGDFFADVAGLPHPAHDHLPLALHAREDRLHRRCRRSHRAAPPAAPPPPVRAGSRAALARGNPSSWPTAARRQLAWRSRSSWARNSTSKPASRSSAFSASGPIASISRREPQSRFALSTSRMLAAE